MKKVFTYFAAAMIAASGLFLVSCDDDDPDTYNRVVVNGTKYPIPASEDDYLLYFLHFPEGRHVDFSMTMADGTFVGCSFNLSSDLPLGDIFKLAEGEYYTWFASAGIIEAGGETSFMGGSNENMDMSEELEGAEGISWGSVTIKKLRIGRYRIILAMTGTEGLEFQFYWEGNIEEQPGM